MAKPKFTAPKGTRDLYPDDLLRQRYITQAWRDTAIRHGFDEIAGPTFETADLYAVKSGEGILGELFQAFSGKSPEEVEQVKRSGMAPYALRPEFTPTLARMYAAKAGSLPSPCRWFTAGPYFRAERPQRGRLREFLQWNCDVIGAGDAPESRAHADFECVSVAFECLRGLGLSQNDIKVEANHRECMATILEYVGIARERHAEVYDLLDRRSKLKGEEFAWAAAKIGLNQDSVAQIEDAIAAARSEGFWKYMDSIFFQDREDVDPASATQFFHLLNSMNAGGLYGCWRVNLAIVRGLAYYTGTVFEVIAEGERAVAGGGRYDNLIELFGGPSTPAVGFGMGDVVLTNLLDDRKLMPEGADLMDAVSRPPASLRPDAFVFAASDEAAEHVVPLVARLRRGIEQADFDGKPWAAERYVVPPMHARKSDKATRKVGKLLADAKDQRARFVVIVESADKANLKDMTTGEQREMSLEEVPRAIAGA